jgi:hypothetical protein
MVKCILDRCGKSEKGRIDIYIKTEIQGGGGGGGKKKLKKKKFVKQR